MFGSVCIWLTKLSLRGVLQRRTTCLHAVVPNLSKQFYLFRGWWGAVFDSRRYRTQAWLVGSLAAAAAVTFILGNSGSINISEGLTWLFSGSMLAVAANFKINPLAKGRDHFSIPKPTVAYSQDGGSEDVHRINRVISVEDEHFYGVTLSCGIDFLPDVLQPSCGGLVFKKLSRQHFKGDSKNKAYREAEFLAKEADITSSLWNAALRGASTVLISDGTLAKEEVFRRWAAALAKEGWLGWKYIVTSELGTVEKDMDVISDTAIESRLGAYLEQKNTDLPSSEEKKLSEILVKRKWNKLGPQLRWELGLVLPAAGCSEKKGGYPTFGWDLGGTALVSTIQMILWFRKHTGPINIFAAFVKIAGKKGIGIILESSGEPVTGLVQVPLGAKSVSKRQLYPE